MGEIIKTTNEELPVSIPGAHVVMRDNVKFLAILSTNHSSLYQWTCIRKRNPHAFNIDEPTTEINAIPVSTTRCAEIKEAAEAASSVQKGLRGVIKTLRSLLPAENIFRDMEPPPNYTGSGNLTLKPVLAEKDPYLVVSLKGATVTEEQVHTLFPNHDAEEMGNGWLVTAKR